VKLVAGPALLDAGALLVRELEQLPESHVAWHGHALPDLRGLRFGICRPFFDDAEPAVAQRCEEVLRACIAAGARLIEVPAPDLNTMLWCHTTLILSEMAEALRPHLEKNSRRFGADARINLAIGAFLRGPDYALALRHRTRLIREQLAMMEEVDIVVTPTAGCVAPPIRPAALSAGESDLPTVDALMRFIRLANITGFPGLSVPAGYDDGGLPIGIQFVGRPWEEDLLLRVGLTVEQVVVRRRPAHHVTLLR
jgi:Asp-tRNA(Asn)/Glu-tRNA(Gln) amidotransferase A subunit family amidase